MNPQIYFNEVNERQGVFHRRAFLMGGVAGVGLLALGSRLAYLQLVEANKYKTLSLDNEFESRLQPPPRGLITDRNGVVLALAVAYGVMSLVTGVAPNLVAVGWMYALPTLLLFPFARRLAERYEDADVRFR